MRLTGREKHWLVAAGLVACVLGAFVGYLALQPELEAQFHGGVLEQDRVRVLWQNAGVTAVAFVCVASASFAALGLLPILLRRLLRRMCG